MMKVLRQCSPERFVPIITSRLHELSQLSWIWWLSQVFVQQVQGEQVPDTLLARVTQYSWNLFVKYEIFELEQEQLL